MSLEFADKICELQGIIMHIEVMVLCPSCGRKSLKLDITDDQAECIRCNNEYKSIGEVLEIEKADYLEKNKETDIQMRTNRGEVR